MDSLKEAVKHLVSAKTLSTLWHAGPETMETISHPTEETPLTQVASEAMAVPSAAFTPITAPLEQAGGMAAKGAGASPELASKIGSDVGLVAATVAGAGMHPEAAGLREPSPLEMKPVVTPAGDIVEPNPPAHPMAEEAVMQKLESMGADVSDPQSIANTVAESHGVTPPSVAFGDVPVSQTVESGKITLSPDATPVNVVHETLHDVAAKTGQAHPIEDNDATAAQFLRDGPSTPAIDPEGAVMAYPSISDQKNITKGLLRERGAAIAIKAQRAQAALEDDHAFFQKQPAQVGIDFMSRMDEGLPQATPRLDATSQAIDAMFKRRVQEVRDLGTGKMDELLENYFPHLWADPAQATAFYQARNLQPTTGFMKQRTIPTFREGMEAGLVPMSTNPVEMGLLRMAQMDRYVETQKAFAQMDDLGTRKFAKSADQAPQGWVPQPMGDVYYTNDAGERVLAGRYYMPKESAAIIDNHLSPGLANMQGFLGDVFRGYRAVGNTLNQAQLGLSAFHAGMTTISANVDQVALGLGQIARGASEGDLGTAAKGILNLRGAVTGWAETLQRGHQFLKDVLTDGPMTEDVKNLVAGGGRARQDAIYTNALRNRFAEAWRDAYREGGLPGALGDAATNPLRTIGAMLEAQAAPVMEWYVPRMKLGAFLNMARDTVAQLGPDATPEMRRFALGKAWNAVDGRFGQVVYDNVFVNQAVKDLGFASVRALGWTGGTIEQIGGGLLDAVKMPKRYRQILFPDVEDPSLSDPLMTQRMKFVVALPIVVGTYGAIGQYLMTGKGPEELKDYFFPKTGAVNPDGSPVRVSLPSYMRDIAAVASATKTGYTSRGVSGAVGGLSTFAEHKLHPLLSMVANLLENRDYYGTQIRNEDDPVDRQGADLLGYLGRQTLPFSAQSYLKGKEAGLSTPRSVLSFIGIQPSPKYINQSEAEAVMSDYEEKNRGQLARTKEEAARSKAVGEIYRAFREDGPEKASALIRQAVSDRNLAVNDIPKIAQMLRQPPIVARFRRLPVEWQTKVMKVATPAQRAILEPHFQRALVRVGNSRTPAELDRIETALGD